jgi:hypothetical protein
MRGHVFNSHASGLDCILNCTYSLEDGARGGSRCESEGMRGHVFRSHASKLDCALYYTYSLEDGMRGGPGVRVRGSRLGKVSFDSVRAL